MRQLSSDDLAAAWDRYRQDQCPDALETLVCHYHPLAQFLARRSAARAPSHQDFDDLLSSAHQGLLQAIERFDPTREIKFETFASRRIAGAIADGQRRDDPLTRSVRGQVKQLQVVQAAAWDRTGRAATVEELATALDIGEQEVRSLLVREQSMAKSLDEDADLTASGMLTDEQTHVQQMAREAVEGLAQRLAALSAGDREFIVRYYVEAMTLRSIGELLGCSDTRCAQIRRAICLRLMPQITPGV